MAPPNRTQNGPTVTVTLVEESAPELPETLTLNWYKPPTTAHRGMQEQNPRSGSPGAWLNFQIVAELPPKPRPTLDNLAPFSTYMLI